MKEFSKLVLYWNVILTFLAELRIRVAIQTYWDILPLYFLLFYKMICNLICYSLCPSVTIHQTAIAVSPPPKAHIYILADRHSYKYLNPTVDLVSTGPYKVWSPIYRFHIHVCYRCDTLLYRIFHLTICTPLALPYNYFTIRPKTIDHLSSYMSQVLESHFRTIDPDKWTRRSKHTYLYRASSRLGIGLCRMIRLPSSPFLVLITNLLPSSLEIGPQSNRYTHQAPKLYCISIHHYVYLHLDE